MSIKTAARISVASKVNSTKWLALCNEHRSTINVEPHAASKKVFQYDCNMALKKAKVNRDKFYLAMQWFKKTKGPEEWFKLLKQNKVYNQTTASKVQAIKAMVSECEKEDCRAVTVPTPTPTPTPTSVRNAAHRNVVHAVVELYVQSLFRKQILKAKDMSPAVLSSEDVVGDVSMAIADALVRSCVVSRCVKHR